MDDLILSEHIVRDVMPVILRDRNCTWKVHFSSFNKKIYLNWSVCEALVNLGINCVDAFKVKTLIGTHKKSMSERNGFKYSATISKWSIVVDERTGEKKCIFELMPVMFEGVMTPYEIVVRCENCDMNRFDLEKQLTDYTNSIYLGKNDIIAIKQWKANLVFTRTLFKIIREVMPVILRDKKTSWRLEINNENLLIKWSVCEELIDIGINSIDEFKILTKDGRHKISASFRKVYKYCAHIDSWNIEGTNCIFKTNEIYLNGNYKPVEIIVRSSNCEHNKIEFVRILDFAVSKGYNISAKSYDRHKIYRSFINANSENIKFASALFNKS